MKKIVFFIILFLFASKAHAGYSRIVSLAPSVTSELYDLNSQDSLVGVTSYCEAEKKEVVGTLLDLNFEKIASLNPDLVIATGEWNSDAAIAKLKRVNLNVAVFGRQDTFQKACDDFIRLGELVGKKQLAQEIVKETKTGANKIFLQVRGLPVKKILWQVNAKPLITIGDNALASDLLRLSGAKNIFADLKTPYSRVSYEEVVKRNPDVIILVGMGNVMKDEMDYWRRLKGIRASGANAIYMLDPYKACQPTPIKFLESLKQIVKLIHPEISCE